LAHEFAIQPGRAALDVEPAGQDALLAHAPVHAVLHDLPDLEQLRADFLLAAPGLLVRHDEFMDREPMARALLEQLVAAGKLVRHLAAVAAGAIARLVAAHDEAAADGKVF